MAFLIFSLLRKYNFCFSISKIISSIILFPGPNMCLTLPNKQLFLGTPYLVLAHDIFVSYKSEPRLLFIVEPCLHPLNWDTYDFLLSCETESIYYACHHDLLIFFLLSENTYDQMASHILCPLPLFGPVMKLTWSDKGNNQICSSAS